MTTFGSSLFYARDLEGLKREGALSLQIILEECTARNIAPRKAKGTFALRLDQDTYRQASIAAAARGKSLNQFLLPRPFAKPWRGPDCPGSVYIEIFHAQRLA